MHCTYWFKERKAKTDYVIKFYFKLIVARIWVATGLYKEEVRVFTETHFLLGQSVRQIHKTVDPERWIRNDLFPIRIWPLIYFRILLRGSGKLKVVTTEKGEALGQALTIIC